jgi:hypothetical protein
MRLSPVRTLRRAVEKRSSCNARLKWFLVVLLLYQRASIVAPNIQIENASYNCKDMPEQCLRNLEEIPYDQYLQETGETISAAEANTAKWYKAELRADCFPALRSATYKIMVNSRDVHKTARELGEELTRDENIYLEYEDGNNADTHLNQTLEMRDKIKKDPDWLGTRRITLRDITANEQEMHEHLQQELLIIEDGLHRTPAIMSLLLSNELGLDYIPVMYARAHDTLLGSRNT